MVLHIDTTLNNFIEIGVGVQYFEPLRGRTSRDKSAAGAPDLKRAALKKKFSSKRDQAEKLLPAIVEFFKAHKLKLSDLKGIEVANRGGSFTSLRVGVVTANALAYSLGIAVAGESGGAKIVHQGRREFKVVEPSYGRAPRITEKA